jgi:hypothetical protein
MTTLDGRNYTSLTRVLITQSLNDKLHCNIALIRLEKPFMKTSLLSRCTLLCIALFSVQIAAQEGPCSADEYRQFDFWVGEWQVTQPDGSVAGKNTISLDYQGCVLTENYSVQGQPFGASLNGYDRATQKWYQTWMDRNGTVLRLSGGLKQGSMVLSGDGMDPQGNALTHQITWTPNADGTVEQHWQFRPNGAEEWSTLFKGMYTKLK